MSGDRSALVERLSASTKVVAAKGSVNTTLGLRPFVTALQNRSAPLILDLGPAIGSNVTFLGEQLGCKLVVEDLLESLPVVPDPEAEGPDGSDSKDGEGDERPEPIPRLVHPDESVDGVLCWDVLDYLSPTAGRALADELVRVLRPRGALLLSHGTESLSQPGRVEYEIINETSLRYRLRSGVTKRPRRVLQSREVSRMFGSLAISDSFLLKSRMREVLFRRPAASAAGV